MTFRVIARLRDDGDYEPIAAFSVDLIDELGLPVDDWVQKVNEYVQATNGNEIVEIVDLASVEDVMAEEYFNCAADRI